VGACFGGRLVEVAGLSVRGEPEKVTPEMDCSIEV
jgi:hypothetical protein